jgi:N-methylhydantoinase A
MTSYQIGCDIGGTFTDVCVIDDEGRVFTDKSDTTPADLTQGVVASLESVGAAMDISLDQLLGATTRFVNGTTVVTNSIAELDGSRVGLIITKGFGDTLRIARSPRNGERDFQLQRNIPDLVDRDCIVEVEERIDRNGEVVVPLAEAEITGALDALLAKGIEALAVSFLFSFANPVHEQRVAEIAREQYPELYLSVSSELYPMMREYERTVTTVLNSFTGVRVARYTDAIEGILAARGLGVPISFMQAFGGTLPREEARARPIALVDSGPAGGVVGAKALGEEIGVENIITADMGGTSFDVSVIREGEYTVAHRVMLREFLTGVSKVDVLAIGAGGGSLGWVDVRGIAQVGPRSAGAEPGPAAYGRGGTQATVTDAVLALGLLGSSWFLGGRRSLDVEAAREAVRSSVASPLDISVEEAASAMYRLVTANMSDAVRRVTVERGRDPRAFTMCAYGGALGVFAADICRRTGIRKVVIPKEAAVFSAYGLLATDDIRAMNRSIFWTGGDVGEVESLLRELEGEALEGLRRSGYDADSVELTWQGDFRFAGQIFDLTVPLARELPVAEALHRAQREFPQRYEAEFGPGTAWKDSPIVLLGLRVLAQAQTQKLSRAAAEATTSEAVAAPQEPRQVFMPDERAKREVPVYVGADLRQGQEVDGPALVEHPLTTVWVPAGWRLSVDAHGRQHLDDTEVSTAFEVESHLELGGLTSVS